MPRRFAPARLWDYLLARGHSAVAAGRGAGPVRLSALPLEDRVVPARPLPLPMIFSGSGGGSAPPRVVAHYAETGAVAFERTPFDPSFAGGVRVAAGDIDADAVPDLIAAAGPGGGPHVKVLSGKTGEPIAGPLGSFFAYDPGFAGGVFVAAGDVDGDGRSDVITAAGAGGGPHVKVFSGADGSLLASFMAFAPGFAGGATVMAADFTGDGKADLAVGAGAGGGPHVKVFDLQTGDVIPGPLGSFFAFDVSFAGGVDVGTDLLTGDVSGDGFADLVVGRGPGGPSRVRVFDGKSGAVHAEFSPFGNAMTAGVRVATAFVTDDSRADIVVGTGAGPTARVRVFDGVTLAELPAPLSGYVPFGAGFTGGVFVAASNDPPVEHVRTDPVSYSPLSPIPSTSAFTVTAEVHDPFATDGVLTPTGTITLTIDGVTAGTQTVSADPADSTGARAVFSFAAGSYAAGTHTVSYSYSGDSHYYPESRGYNPTFTVSPPPPGPPPPPPLPTVAVKMLAHALEPSTDGLFLFSRTGSLSSSLTVNYKVDGSAAPGVDYLGLPPVVFAPGESQKKVPVKPLADALDEPEENVFVQIEPGAYFVLVGGESANVLIRDEDREDAPATECVECGDGSPHDLPDGGQHVGPAAKTPGGVSVTGRVRVSQAGMAGRGGAIQTTPFFGGGFGGDATQNLLWAGGAGVDAPFTTLYWGNGGYSDLLTGVGGRLGNVPRLVPKADGSLVAEDGPLSGRAFAPDGLGGYLPRFGEPGTLTKVGGEYKLTDGTGNLFTYFAHDAAIDETVRGQLKSRVDAAGRTTTLDYPAVSNPLAYLGLPGTVTWTDPVIGVSERVRLAAGWVGDLLVGRHDRLTGITLERQVGLGGWQEVERLALSYSFLSTPSFPGTTHLAVLSGVTRTTLGAEVGRTYTRYYAALEANGYEGGVKFHLGEKAAARLRAAFPGVTDLDTLTDAQVAGYADLALEYDAQRRVTRITRAGEGCSACSGGMGAAVLTYATSSFAAGVNTWKYKVTETLDDGTVTTLYANAYGQLLLSATTEAGTGKTWASYFRYDANHRLVLRADPSAVSGFSEAYSDLVGYAGGNAAYLRDAAGVVTVYSYGGSTTATDAAAGDVARFHKGTSIQQGEFGTAAPQLAVSYLTRTANGHTSYHLAGYTWYENANGTGAQTAVYSYGWLTGWHHAQTVTLTLPTVTAGRNGPGTASVWTVVRDTDGQAVWGKDAAGFLFHAQYDPGSAAAVKTIADVNTTLGYDFTGLPGGWTTPAGGGLHQKSTYEVDPLGRATRLTDPLGRVTYVVFKDAAHEVRVYRGWTAGGPTGPTEVYREDWGQGYAEWLTMTAFPTVIGGRPVGTEGIDEVRSLARELTNTAGQVVYSDAYVSLTGTTYSTALTLGTAGTNYLRTQFGYDKQGRPSKWVSPAGTITRLVSDAIGRPVSTWVGTNDTPATGFWSPSNPAGMTQVDLYQYDYDGVGDSNLTAYAAYPGSGRASRVSEFAYDWRNRPVAVKGGVQGGETESVNRPLTFVTYDNLDQVLTAEVYDGDTVGVSAAPPAASRLRARAAYSYDESGRVYRTDAFGVNQTTGAVAGTPLTSQVWYDRRGLAVKASSPDGQVVKQQYDGLGRPTVGYLSDGGGDASWADALTVTGDTVWSQAESAYDLTDNLIQSTTRSRVFGQTGTGGLGTPTSGVLARVSYAGYYYDSADRLTDFVAVGTNGGAAWTRPGSVPARSDAALVTSVAYGPDGLPQDVTDPRGITARTAYDLLGRTTSTTAAFGTADAFTVTSAYDTGGRLASVSAPGTPARTTQYAYDSLERVSGVTERVGTAYARTSTFAYDLVGGLVSATDPVGTRTDYTENVLGQVTSVTAAANIPALARTASSAFDALGRVVSVTDPRANSTAYSYDDIARTATVTDALGNAWTTAFDKAGRTTGVTDPYGKTTTLAYDLPGRLVSVADPLAHTSTFQYTVNGSEDRAIDPLTHTTRRTYDTFGRVGSVIDPLGNTTAFAYDRNSNPVTVTNANGVSTAFAYDNLDRRVSVTEAVGKTEQRTTGYAYNAAGDLTTVTDPLNRQTAYTYDTAGRMTAVTLAANKAEAFTVSVGYDLLDRPAAVYRPGGRATAYAYDELSQLTKVTEGVGTALERHTTFGYDAAGNTVSVTNPLTFTTNYAYDKLNRVTSVTDPEGGVVAVAYDKAGRRASFTDPVSNVTAWGYDAAGRLTTETDPLGKVTGYTYDDANRLTSITDRLGRKREFGYDDAGRVTSEVWKTAGGSTVQTQTFGYDAVGNQTSATDPDGSYALTYDNLNRVVSVSGPFGVTQTFGYDAADNRTSAADNMGTVTTSAYDHLNRLTSRAQAVGGVNVLKAEWTYDSKGDRTGVSRSSWTGSAWALAGSSAYTFDDLGRATGFTHKNAAGTTVGSGSYTFDAGDRVTAQTVNGDTRTFGYDKTGQLTNDNGMAYTYDKAGNRTGAGIVVGAGNRLTSDGTWAYTYDDAGQMTGKSKSGEAWAFTYDHRGQMTGSSKSATVGGTVTDGVSYQTDAWGVRVGRVQTGTTSSTERYVVDGWDTAKPGAIGTESFDAVLDLDGSNAVTTRRLYGAGFDEPVARRDAGGGVSWYGADALGSVRQVFDNSGNAVGGKSYTAFGSVSASTGGGFDRYAWSGAGTDPLTGQVGSRRRIYDVDKRGWTSDDPIGFAAGDSNLSRYVGNGPTNATDPSGLQPPSFKDRHDYTEWYRANESKIRGMVAQNGMYKDHLNWLNRAKQTDYYAKDNDYRSLVDQLEKHLQSARVDELSGKSGYTAWDPSYLFGPFNSTDTPMPSQADRKAVEGAAEPMCGQQRDAWRKETARLSAAISRREYELKYPRSLRFVAGFVAGGAKAITGTVEIIIDPGKAAVGAWNLATDYETQKAILEELAKRLSDPSAENLGEWTFDIASIAFTGPGSAGVKAGAQAVKTSVKVTVKVSRETVDKLRKAAEKVNLDNMALSSIRKEMSGRIGSTADHGAPGTGQASKSPKSNNTGGTGNSPGCNVTKSRERHYAEYELRDSKGKKKAADDKESGVEFPLDKGQKLTFPEQSWYGHTEGKIIDELMSKNLLKQGDVLVIRGERPPCSSCQNIMRWASERFGITVAYQDDVLDVWRWVNGIIQKPKK